MSHSTPDPNDEHGSVYDGLLGTDTSQWAFGTDFEDPLAGVDTTVPDDLDPAELAAYCLLLGDDALVMSQPPERVVQQRARPRGGHRARQHRARPARPGPAAAGPRRGRRPVASCRRCPRARRCRSRTRSRSSARRSTSATSGWSRSRTATSGTPIARLLLFATVRLAAFERLVEHRDPVLAAIAAKGVKELTYHRDYAGRWFLTLAQGTDESRRRLTGRADRALAALRRAPRGVRRRAGRRRRPRPGLRGLRRRTPRGRRRWPVAATPRRSPGCSPRCRSWPARTRRGSGEDALTPGDRGRGP